MRHVDTRLLFVLLVTILAGVGFAACGDVNQKVRSTSRSSTTSATRSRDAEDFDSDYGDDDDAILKYGHMASPAERQAVTVLVKRYYAAAAARDGARACPMLTAGLARTLPENHAPQAGTHAARVDACAPVASMIFHTYHRELAAKATALQVTELRIDGGRGLALLRFPATPEPRKIAVRREAGVWKIDEVLDGGVP